MSGSLNEVFLIGNLCRDVEVRTFQNGGKVANLRIATSDVWKDKQSGERKERSEYHSVAIHNESIIRVAEQFLRKGSKVYIKGKLQTRKWQDQSGQDRYSTEIVMHPYESKLIMLDGKSDNGGQGGYGGQSGYGGNEGGNRRIDDEIPF